MDGSAHKTAHALLDFHASQSDSVDLPERQAAFRTATSGLQDAEALVVTVDGNGDVSVDFTPLLAATGVTYVWLIERLVETSGKSEEEVVFELRQFIDRQLDN